MPPLQATWFAHTEAFAHHQAQVECRGVNEQPLENVFVTSEMSAPHASGLVQMCKGPLDELTAGA